MRKEFVNVTIIPMLLILTLFSILLFNPYLYHYFEYSGNHFVFAIIIFTASAIVFLNLFTITSNTICLNNIDILFCLYLFWICASRLSYSGFNMDNEGVINFLSISVLYPVIRLGIHSDKAIMILFAGIGFTFLIETGIICYQLNAISEFDGNSFLLLKGTLDNSGLAAGYLVLIAGFCMGYRYFKPIRNRLLEKILLILFWVALLSIILLAKSRAALLSYILVLFLEVRFLFPKKFLKQVSLTTASFFKKALLIIVSFLFFFCLYKIKKMSAIGRILIWKISLLHFMDHPLTGIGFGEFPVKYPFWQADYFASHVGDIDSSTVAGIPNTSFNEPLQILIETGIVGLIIFVFLVTTSLLQNVKEGKKELFRPIKNGLLGLMVFSFFSYPLHSLPMAAIFVISIALLANVSVQKAFSLRPPAGFAKLIYGLLIVLNIWVAYCFYLKNGAIRMWKLEDEKNHNDSSSLIVYKEIHERLKENGLFLFKYGEVLLNNNSYVLSSDMFYESSKKLINYETYIKLGISNQRQKNITEARKYYSLACRMTPNRFWPKYFLANLFIEENDIDNARKMAEEIISMPVKIPSAEVLSIQLQMRDFLRTGTHREQY